MSFPREASSAAAFEGLDFLPVDGLFSVGSEGVLPGEAKCVTAGVVEDGELRPGRSWSVVFGLWEGCGRCDEVDFLVCWEVFASDDFLNSCKNWVIRYWGRGP